MLIDKVKEYSRVAAGSGLQVIDSAREEAKLAGCAFFAFGSWDVS
jgi:hypothetical protein